MLSTGIHCFRLFYEKRLQRDWEREKNNSRGKKSLFPKMMLIKSESGLA